jgi:hypothetical protein
MPPALLRFGGAPAFDSRDLPQFAVWKAPFALVALFLRTSISTEVMVVMNQQIRALVFAAGAALLSAGCYATAGSSAVAYAEVDSAPIEIDIATYPHTYYEGRNVYFYQDRWYYQDSGRWSYYRDEPPMLYRQRGYVQQAPSAHQEQDERARRERSEHDQQERAQREQQERAQHEQQDREREEEGRRKHLQATPQPQQRPGPKPKPGPKRPNER